MFFKTQKQPSRGVLTKISGNFTEHPCRRSVISIKLLCNFTEITPRHECYPVDLRHIFREPFYKNTYMEDYFWKQLLQKFFAKFTGDHKQWGHSQQNCNLPVDTRRRFNVHQTSIRRRRRRIDVLQTLKRRSVSNGLKTFTILCIW